MHPCGNCEKCRRIIGMIMALDENPKACGYSEQQIEKGLKALASRSVKQIGSDAKHLYAMLLDKALLPENDFTKKAAKEHVEIMKLRFDSERSNLEDLPEHVRKPVFNILTKYSTGAVQRLNKSWVDVTVDDEFLKKSKYKHNER